MVHWQVYPLLHPKVQEARDVFYEHRLSRWSTSRCTLSFEVLYDLFCNEVADFAAIAELASIANGSLDQLYDNNFASLFWNMSAAHRRHLFLDERRKEFLGSRRTSLPDILWMPLIQKNAAAAGHSVEAVIYYNERGWYQGIWHSKVAISGTNCKVHALRTPRRPLPGRNQRFGRSEVFKDKLEEESIQLFPILIRGLKQETLVIPSAKLREHYFPHDRSNAWKVDLNIPLKRGQGKRKATSFPFIDYAERWDLIPKAT